LVCLLETWDAVTGADHVEHKKPAPDIFLAAAKQLDLMPNQCVVIEDASHGVQAAKSAGMRCVALTHTFDAAQLAQADLIKDSICEIKLHDLFEDLRD
jgi:beta-phosphoglucomutase-like phosphatase (HAD superfamily)